MRSENSVVVAGVDVVPTAGYVLADDPRPRLFAFDESLHEGAVSLNVWLDSAGIAPIISGSSSFHEFDVTMPTNYKGITIPFEQIAEIHVVPADQNFGRFHVH